MSVCVGTCAGGVRFSNSNRIIHSDYRILLLLKMHIPNIYIYIYIYICIYICVCVYIYICVCVCVCVCLCQRWKEYKNILLK